MIAGNCTATVATLRRISHGGATLVGVVALRDGGRALKVTTNGRFESPDICTVATAGVRHTAIVDGSRHSPLIRSRTGSHTRIDRRTAGVESHRKCRSTVVCERRQQRVDAGLIAGAGKAESFRHIANQVVATTRNRSVNIGTGNRSAGSVTESVCRGVSGNDRIRDSHRTWTHANATTGSFTNEPRWLVRSALIDAGVAG